MSMRRSLHEEGFEELSSMSSSMVEWTRTNTDIATQDINMSIGLSKMLIFNLPYLLVRALDQAFASRCLMIKQNYKFLIWRMGSGSKFMKQKHFWNDVRSLQEQCNWSFIIVQLRCLSGFWKPFHVKLKKRKMILCIQTLNTQQEAFCYKKELQGAKQGSSNLVTKLKSGLPIHSTFNIVIMRLPKTSKVKKSWHFS